MMMVMVMVMEMVKWMVMNADPLIPDLFIAHLGEALSLCQVGDPPTEMMTQDPACFISISDHFMFETQL